MKSGTHFFVRTKVLFSPIQIQKTIKFSKMISAVLSILNIFDLDLVCFRWGRSERTFGNMGTSWIIANPETRSGRVFSHSLSVGQKCSLQLNILTAKRKSGLFWKILSFLNLYASTKCLSWIISCFF